MIFKKAIKGIEDRYSEDIRQKNIESILDKSISSLKKDTIMELLTGQYPNEEYIIEKLLISDIKITENKYAVFIAKVLGERANTDVFNESLANIQEWMQKNGWGYAITGQYYEIIGLINAPNINEQWCKLLVEHIYNKFSLSKLNYIVAIGGMKSEVHRIKHSYIEAQEALKYYYAASYHIVEFNEIQLKKKTMSKIAYPANLENDLIDALKLANYKKLNQLLNPFFNTIDKKETDIDSLKNATIELIFNVKKGLMDININYSDIFADEYDEIYKINDLNNIEDILSSTFFFFERIIQYIEMKTNKNNKHTVQYILNYIDENYTSPDISIGEIADKVHFTPNYISLLIKQEMGEDFIDIIINKRIEKAKDLMFDLSLKIYEISQKVGYTDANYFSKVFKKVVGITPVEFKNKFCD